MKDVLKFFSKELQKVIKFYLIIFWLALVLLTDNSLKIFSIAGLNKNSFLSKIRKKKAQFILFYLAQRASIYSA